MNEDLLRERTSRQEVQISHLTERLREVLDMLQDTGQRLGDLTDQIVKMEHRLNLIERQLATAHRFAWWAFASLGTITIEAFTGTLRAFLKLLAQV